MVLPAEPSTPKTDAKSAKKEKDPNKKNAGKKRAAEKAENGQRDQDESNSPPNKLQCAEDTAPGDATPEAMDLNVQTLTGPDNIASEAEKITRGENSKIPKGPTSNSNPPNPPKNTNSQSGSRVSPAEPVSLEQKMDVMLRQM